MIQLELNSWSLLLKPYYPDHKVGLKKRLTCIWSTVVAICSAVNCRQGCLRSRLHVRSALAVSRVAVLFHYLDFRLQTEHRLFLSVSTRKRFRMCVFAIDPTTPLKNIILVLILFVILRDRRIKWVIGLGSCNNTNLATCVLFGILACTAILDLVPRENIFPKDYR